MQLRGDRARRVRHVLRATLVTGTAAAAVLTAVAVAPVAAAEPAARAVLGDYVAHLKPSAGISTKSSSGGARSGDFTGDGVSDILARDANNGQLKVYPHSGSYVGTSTYQPSTTINFGWGGIRWIGQGDFNGDHRADVVYVDAGGNMRVALHSGSFNGTATLGAGTFIGSGWTINDLIFTDDWDGDGLDDVVARRAGTDAVYVYFNLGLNGTATLAAPQLVLSGAEAAVEMAMGDFTGDGVTDLLFIEYDGYMGLFDFMAAGGQGDVYLLGWGWETINAITLTDVNVDGAPDVLGRTSNGVLWSYTHTRYWAPDFNNQALGTLNGPVVLGYGWNINNVIV